MSDEERRVDEQRKIERESFEEAAKPLMEWMLKHSDPHSIAIVDNMNAMLMNGRFGVPSDYNRKLRGF